MAGTLRPLLSGLFLLCACAGAASGKAGRTPPAGNSPHRAGGCGAPHATPLARRFPYPPRGVLHGVFPGGVGGNEDDSLTIRLRRYERAVGLGDRHVAWVYFSHNWFDTARAHPFPMDSACSIRRHGSVPFIRLMLRSQRDYERSASIGDRPGYPLASIADGSLDERLRPWFRGAAHYRAPLLVEYGTEVNLMRFPWNQAHNGGAAGPARFVDAFRHLVTLSREEGATNIRWVFHVNYRDDPVAAGEDSTLNRLERYYPGDSFVDVVAVSLYGPQTRNAREQDYQEESFRLLMDSVYPRLACLGETGRPIIVAEMGAAANGQGKRAAARWAEDAIRELRGRARWPRVVGFAWWNSRFDDTDLLVDGPLADVFGSEIRTGTILHGIDFAADGGTPPRPAWCPGG